MFAHDIVTHAHALEVVI